MESELRSVEGKNKKEIQSKSDRVIRKLLGMPIKYRTPTVT